MQMKINGNLVAFGKGGKEQIISKIFHDHLVQNIKKDFEDTCNNDYFKSNNINEPLMVVLSICLVVNFVLIIWFIVVYVQVKKQKKKFKNEAINTVKEKLYIN